ncbi:MAG TPA: aldehyde dehydrogenase family protein [Terriglobia bacterium]|jgi:succinate-semialdehyde dehydrogenase/glutarate-semialdehyde dehydrogenase
MGIASINPATGNLIRRFTLISQAEVNQKLRRACAAFHEYRRTLVEERARMMQHAAAILDDEKESFGRLMTAEMGKTLRAAMDESEKCAWVCRYFAESAGHWLAGEVIETGGALSFVRYDPLGAVLAIMPWNFPFWQVFRFAAPALMAGNVALLKHASNVPQCALAIEDVFRRAGFPAGVFQTLRPGTQRPRNSGIYEHQDGKHGRLEELS